MVEEHILDGDFILVEKMAAVAEGDIVVALDEGAQASVRGLQADAAIRLPVEALQGALGAGDEAALTGCLGLSKERIWSYHRIFLLGGSDIIHAPSLNFIGFFP